MGCRYFKCRHNVFWEGLNNIRIFKSNKYSESINNCMLNISEEASLEDIGQIYGLTREAIRQIEKRVLTISNKKLKVIKKLELDDFV